MNRRYFLTTSSAALATAASGRGNSPSDRVRVACVGVRSQGNAHLKQYGQMQNVEIAAICDVDDNVLNQRLSEVEKTGRKRPTGYSDIRKLLEDKSIDAISIATPNHNHTMQTIWACQAGRHVYVEKPCSHDMFEAKQIVAAAHKYKRLVQHGTNSRSGAAREAIAHMREGLIGDTYMARGLCFKWRPTIGKKPVSPVPAGVNYDLWLGPAPKHAFTANRFHYNWHWFWDYGNGDLGNQGIHQIDVCRWGLGVKYPTKITATGGHFLFDDDQETPNTLNANFEFNTNGKKQVIEFAVRGWMTNKEAGIGAEDTNCVGATFYGSKGYLAVEAEDFGKYKTYLGQKGEPGPSGSDMGNNWANFISAVRSGKHSDLNAPIEEGAISTTLVHLANISYRLGRTLNFDEATYSCTGDPEANRMFRRTYRAPFVVPESV
jgi:predicted dehydrogenase